MSALCEFLLIILDGQHNEDPDSSSVSDYTSCKSLEEALMSIDMEEHLRILQREQMDMESLVCSSYFHSNASTLCFDHIHYSFKYAYLGEELFLFYQTLTFQSSSFFYADVYIYILFSFFFLLFQMLCSERDLRDLGIPLGPCKKIMNCVKKLKVWNEEMCAFYTVYGSHWICIGTHL